MKCGRLVRLCGNWILICAVFVPCFPFPLPSVTEWPRCRPWWTWWWKKHHCNNFPPIYRILCIVSLRLKPGLLPRTFDVFYFSYVTAVQARWRHPHIPLMRSSHARFSGSAGEALSSSSLCHCWHLQSFCYRVGVGFVGGLLQCHPSKPRVTNLPQLRILRSLCKAGFGMDLKTNCMVHGYKVQLIPVMWMASEKAQLLVDICISYGPWQQTCKPPVFNVFS